TCALAATLDIPPNREIHLNAPCTTCTRTMPLAVDQPQGPLSPRTEIPPSTPAQEVVPQQSDAQESQVSMIVETLADGTAKDVVSVSSELEKKGSFVDINQVRSLCEKLDQQRRCARV